MIATKPLDDELNRKSTFLYVFSYSYSNQGWQKVYEDQTDEIGGNVLDISILGKGSISGDKKEQLLVGRTIAGSRHGFDWYLIGEKFKPVDLNKKSIEEIENIIKSYGVIQIQKAEITPDNFIKETGQIFNDTDPNCCPSGPYVYFNYRLKNDKLIYDETAD